VKTPQRIEAATVPPGAVANLETVAFIVLTAVLVFVEVRREWTELVKEKQRRVQRKLDIAVEVAGWSWATVVTEHTSSGAHVSIVDVARTFGELASILDFEVGGDQVVENDLRQVIGGLVATLRGTSGVDASKAFEAVKERMSWGLMGWVEKSEQLRHPVQSWWARVRARRRFSRAR